MKPQRDVPACANNENACEVTTHVPRILTVERIKAIMHFGAAAEPSGLLQCCRPFHLAECAVCTLYDIPIVTAAGGFSKQNSVASAE